MVRLIEKGKIIPKSAREINKSITDGLFGDQQFCVKYKEQEKFLLFQTVKKGTERRKKKKPDGIAILPPLCKGRGTAIAVEGLL